MSEMDVAEQGAQFLETCDSRVEGRLNEIAAQGVKLSVNARENVMHRIESDITGFIEKGLTAHPGHFIPDVLADLHHLIVARELQKLGVDNQGRIHRYKDNGQVALSVIEGTLKPDSALLVMQINHVHRQKKGSSENGVCEDCVCGKK